MVASMTALAATSGGADRIGWTIELRSVNAKGLDVRMRLPDRLAASEPKFRNQIQSKISRGAVSLSVRLEQAEDLSDFVLDETALSQAIAAAIAAQSLCKNQGLAVRDSNVAELLALPGVLKRADPSEAELSYTALEQDFLDALDQFLAMRAKEGTALAEILRRQLKEIETLIENADAAAVARKPKAEKQFRIALEKVVNSTDSIDEGRIAQELAVLATKADVTEEIDRLRAHVSAAQALLAEEQPIGRRLDFLMQEFNREANTLCSKSGDSALTAVGLDLKATIEQMREQVQNVE